MAARCFRYAHPRDRGAPETAARRRLHVPVAAKANEDKGRAQRSGARLAWSSWPCSAASTTTRSPARLGDERRYSWSTSGPMEARTAGRPELTPGTAVGG